MIVICTGISGVGKLEYLQALKAKNPDSICVYDVGSKMLDVAANLYIETSTEKILDMPDTTQTALRSTVFEQILPELQNPDPAKHYIIALHASFRWKQVLALGFNAYYLKQITELAQGKGIRVIYVCFTDTASKIYARLEQRDQWKGKLSIEEILLWSNEEAALTKMIAEYEKAAFLLLASEEPIESLWNIVSHPSKKKLYLSFPITIIKKHHPNLLEEVFQFRDKLRCHFVVFDPLAVKDVEWLKGEYQPPDELRGDGAVQIPPPSDTAKAYVESQTVARDFQLVDQSDFVVVYYKTELVSFGVISEMIHGYSNNKAVYAVWEGSISPFFSHYCTAWRADVDSLLIFLTKKYPA